LSTVRAISASSASPGSAAVVTVTRPVPISTSTAVVTAYQREHGKELHLIIASRDLTVYRHLHPARAADGT
jgi:hypothetical protein